MCGVCWGCRVTGPLEASRWTWGGPEAMMIMLGAGKWKEILLTVETINALVE